MFRVFIPFILVFFSAQSFAIDYKSAMSCEDETKFNWYCEEKKSTPLPEKILEPIASAEPLMSYEEQKLKEFDELQEKLVDLRKIAIVDPSYENIKNYITQQNKVQSMSAVFADSWKRVLWQNPTLDYSVKHAVNNSAKKEFSKLLASKKLETLAELNSLGWGMMFFYSSNCSYCHTMVPVVNMLNDNGLEVLPVAIDGKPLGGLNRNFRVDQGQAKQLGVRVTPSLYLVNMKDNIVFPIATGVVSYDDVLTRIYITVKTEPGENY